MQKARDFGLCRRVDLMATIGVNLEVNHADEEYCRQPLIRGF